MFDTHEERLDALRWATAAATAQINEEWDAYQALVAEADGKGAYWTVTALVVWANMAVRIAADLIPEGEVPGSREHWLIQQIGRRFADVPFPGQEGHP